MKDQYKGKFSSWCSSIVKKLFKNAVNVYNCMITALHVKYLNENKISSIIFCT